MKRLVVSTLFAAMCAVLPASASAQKEASLPQDTIARVGVSAITAGELIQRLEMMPFPEKQTKGQADSTKIRALAAMIAEKLLANEARRLNLAEDDRTALMHRELENLLIRDEMYRREVVAGSAPDEAEITRGMERFAKNLKVISFLVKSRDDGEMLRSRLIAGRPDSILSFVPPSLVLEIDTVVIRFGAPDTSFENAAYSIGASRVSGPFHSERFGWSVLYLLGKETNREAAGMSLSDRRHRVQRVLEARHEAERGDEIFYGFLESRHAEADPAVFEILAGAISGLWKEDSVHFRSHGAYILSSDLVDLVAGRLADHVDTVMVRIDDGNLTLGEVLEMFRYEDFRSKFLEGAPFRQDLNEAVKSLVARELLAREGRKQGLANAPSVRHDLQLWSDYWAARALYYHIRDSVRVADDDVFRHLVKNSASFARAYEVNIREVLCASLGQADSVLRALQEGQSLSSLAACCSRRAVWATNNGESGFFAVGEHPEIGFEAMMADSGTLIGPVTLPEGYSIFTVLGKRRTRASVVEFRTLEANIRSRLLSEKRKATLDRYIGGLAREQHVTADYQRAKALKTSSIPMFTRRLIGFGGRMTAVPLLMKQWDWIKENFPPETLLP